MTSDDFQALFPSPDELAAAIVRQPLVALQDLAWRLKRLMSPDSRVLGGQNQGLRVLYVTDRNDPPFQYRCVHACEQLRAVGVPANIARLHDSNLPELVPRYSLIVLFRLPWSSRVAEVVANAKTSGASVAYDVDDLVFDSAAQEGMSFLKRMTKAQVAGYQKDSKLQAMTLQRVDFSIVSTDPLAQAMRRTGLTALVHPNLLGEYQIEQAGRIHAKRERLLQQPCLAYLSGSNTHDGDLASIADALARVLDARPDLLLLLCGHVIAPPRLARLRDRVIQIPFQHPRVYPWIMGRCSAVLAPIESINEFTNAKSNLKVFEAGILGVPAVASPTAENSRAIRSGESGFLAASLSEWEEALHQLTSREVSLSMGNVARQIALDSFSPDAHAGKLATLLAGRAGRSEGKCPVLQPLESADPDWRHPQARIRFELDLKLRTRHFAYAPLAQLAPEKQADPADLVVVRGRRIPQTKAKIIVGGEGCAIETNCEIRNASRIDKNQWVSLNSDPSVVLRVPPRALAWGHLAIELRVKTEAPAAHAQIFWDREGKFCEERSLHFEVAADGAWHTYFIDARPALFANKSHHSQDLFWIRFDPLAAIGLFELGEIAFLTESPPIAEGDLCGRRARVASCRDIPVDIVVPVYNARALTEKCITSVREYATGDWRLVLIDDASTDPDLATYLKQVAASDSHIVLLTNEQNCGFVATANRGIQQASGRDVLLLNSDTEVFADFLDKLRACAYGDDFTGIVTPFSNNATIYSVPVFCRDNAIPVGYTPAQFASLVDACSLRVRPEMPTAVGFCMYVRGAVFDQIGVLDEATFGPGYGEENDLCLRARKAGWQVRLADDVFVFHKGKGSFKDLAPQLARHEEALERKHPGYHAEIARFVESNPLRSQHDEIKFHIGRYGQDNGAAVLYIVHGSPFVPEAGGTEYHVLDLLKSMRPPRAVIAYPYRGSLEFAEILRGEVDRAAFYRFDLRERPKRFAVHHCEMETALRWALSRFDIGAAHIHHLMFWPLALGRILREAEVPYVFTAHDYYSACISWNLFDFSRNQPCPGAAACAGDASCLLALCRELREFEIDDPVSLAVGARKASSDTLAAARAIIFPSETARDTALAAFTFKPRDTVVIEHGYDAALSAHKPRRLPGRLRVAIVGEVACLIKGADNYLDLISKVQDLPLEWHFFGNTDHHGFERRLRQRAPAATLHFHGAYKRDSIIPLLRAEGIDLHVSLPLWHETFSYTLSEALLAGVPALVNSRGGALAERVRRLDAGQVVEDIPAAAAFLRSLCADRSWLDARRATIERLEHRTIETSAREVQALYQAKGIGPPRGARRLDSPSVRNIAAYRISTENSSAGRRV